MTALGLLVVMFGAAETPKAELTYVRTSGATACQQQSLEDAVTKRLGYVPFVVGAPLQVTVSLSGTGTLRARVQVQRPAQPPRESVLSGPADCVDLTEAVALAVVVAIDPLALTRPPAPPPPVAQPAPPPAPSAPPVIETPPAPVVVAATPEPTPTAPPEGPRLGVWLNTGLDLGAQLDGWGSVGVGLRLENDALALELAPLTIFPSQSTLGDSGSVTSWTMGAILAVCGRLGGLSLCGSARGGVVSYEASGLASAQRGGIGFLSAGPRAVLRLPWGPSRLGLRLVGELWFPLLRAGYRVSNDVVWRQSVVMGTLQLGGELFFW